MESLHTQIPAYAKGGLPREWSVSDPLSLQASRCSALPPAARSSAVPIAGRLCTVSVSKQSDISSAACALQWNCLTKCLLDSANCAVEYKHHGDDTYQAVHMVNPLVEVRSHKEEPIEIV